MGQLRIANGKQPVAELLEGDSLAMLERERLLVSQEALAFAHQSLLLPDNGSYRHYFDTGQPYVVWNVVAAPEFSLQPRTWCFPITGCIAYRGYFKQEAAEKYADKLADRGEDVFVGGVTAYSTLGRFRDPVLNTMLPQSETDFVGLIFHELAHQKLYVKDDSAFNEGFATAVEQEGVRRWLRAQGVEDMPRNYGEAQREQVMDLLRAGRSRLTEAYAADVTDADKRNAKATILGDLVAGYDALVQEWEEAGLTGRPYGGLFSLELNNAVLSAVATYQNYVPAFAVLLADCNDNLACFYDAATELGNREPPDRGVEIGRLLQRSQGQ